MTSPTTSLAEINACAPQRFVEILGGVFEHGPWVAAAAAPARPFASIDALHAAMLAAVTGAPRAQRLAFLRGHPELAGAAFRAGSVTAESAGEQAGAALNRLTREEAAAFDDLNRVFRERFGFPFILCMRRNSKESALAAFRARIDAAPEAEEATALSEIAAITRFRLDALMG
jgi:2-oxo-4-hydroxy-4-carboxy-5-ureidoimidazoline decarboxylase